MLSAPVVPHVITSLLTAFIYLLNGKIIILIVKNNFMTFLRIFTRF